MHRVWAIDKFRTNNCIGNLQLANGQGNLIFPRKKNILFKMAMHEPIWEWISSRTLCAE